MRPVVIDTDVMVDFLRGHPSAIALMRKQMNRIILSSMVGAELYAGARSDAELSTLDSVLSFFQSIPVSPDIARAAGLYKREYARSHGVGLVDAIVAATANAENADLLTLNVRHYPMMKNLQPAYTK